MPRKTRQNKATLAPRARVGEKVGHALRQAIDGALEAHVLLLGLPDLPGEAFDIALKTDPGHRAARRAVKRAWKRLEAVLPDEDARQRALAVEEAFVDLSVTAAAVGWKIGIAARGAAQGGR